MAAPQLLDEQMRKLANRSAGRFTPEQAESMIEMMVTVVSADGTPSATQSAFIEDVRSKIVKPATKDGTWS